MAGRKAKKTKAKRGAGKSGDGIFLVIKPMKKQKSVKAMCRQNPTKGATEALKFSKRYAQRAAKAAKAGDCRGALSLQENASLEAGRVLAHLNCMPRGQRREATGDAFFSAAKASSKSYDAIVKACFVKGKGRKAKGVESGSFKVANKRGKAKRSR